MPILIGNNNSQPIEPNNFWIGGADGKPCQVQNIYIGDSNGEPKLVWAYDYGFSLSRIINKKSATDGQGGFSPHVLGDYGSTSYSYVYYTKSNDGTINSQRVKYAEASGDGFFVSTSTSSPQRVDTDRAVLATRFVFEAPIKEKPSAKEYYYHIKLPVGTYGSNSTTVRYRATLNSQNLTENPTQVSAIIQFPYATPTTTGANVAYIYEACVKSSIWIGDNPIINVFFDPESANGHNYVGWTGSYKTSIPDFLLEVNTNKQKLNLPQEKNFEDLSTKAILTTPKVNN